MTVVDWTLFALAVSLLLTLPAWLLDRGLSRVGIPTRWVWLGALALSLGLPIVGILGGTEDTEGNGRAGATASSSAGRTAPRPDQVVWDGGTFRGLVDVLDRWNAGVDRALVSGSTLVPGRPSVQRWAAALWGTTSSLLALVILASMARLVRKARQWPRESWLGRPVRVAPDLGPATLGLMRPEIVVPRWAADLAPDDLELVLRHEEEHARSRDPLAQALGLVPLVACPWNPLIWWQVRRLRDAVELDCDRRVLARGVTAPRYGALLVQLGSRACRDVLAVPAMGGSRSLLERRLTAMRRTRPRTAIPTAFASALAAVPLVIMACSTEPPSPAADLEEIRIEMFFAAMKIELFRTDVGSLPDTVAAGIPGRGYRRGDPVVTIDGIDYALRGDSGYALTSSVGREVLSYDSSRDNPYSWVGLGSPPTAGISWDGPPVDVEGRQARLAAGLFAETLYRDRARLLGWSDESSGTLSRTELLQIVLTSVESSDLEMTLDEIRAADAELRDLRNRYAEDYPPIQELRRQVDTGIRDLTPVLNGIVAELKSRAAEISG